MSDLYAPKDGVVESRTTRSPLSTACAHIIYASFKTHDVMSRYLEHQFKNRPAISTEYVKFLATNLGSEKVVKLVDQVEELKKKLTVALDKVKRATAKADTASTKSAELAKEAAAALKHIKYPVEGYKE